MINTEYKITTNILEFPKKVYLEIQDAISEYVQGQDKDRTGINFHIVFTSQYDELSLTHINAILLEYFDESKFNTFGTRNHFHVHCPIDEFDKLIRIFYQTIFDKHYIIYSNLPLMETFLRLMELNKSHNFNIFRISYVVFEEPVSKIEFVACKDLFESISNATDDRIIKITSKQKQNIPIKIGKIQLI